MLCLCFTITNIGNNHYIRIMENTEYLDEYEISLEKTLCAYLLKNKEIEGMKPDAPDIEGKWESICQSYLPDGIREFEQYPSVSLGWMLFMGMAVAKLWDKNWKKYSTVEDLYLMIRDVRGFDYMDEYVIEDVLKIKGKISQAKLSKLAGDVAVMAHNYLMHENFEAGTPTAFHAFVRTLHQMYQIGYAMQLKRMGYKMTKVNL